MLEVTDKAAELLKAAKTAQGAPEEAGIRIRRAGITQRGNEVAVGFVVSDEPQSGDDAFEQHGLRIFVEDALIGPLEGRTLDVSNGSELPELVFR
jgi:Fe-S cluster assembly iron-binding protein IscA